MSSQLSREVSIAQYVHGRINQVLCDTSSAFHSDLHHVDKASKLPQNNFRPVKCSNPDVSRSRSAMTSDRVLHNPVLESQIDRQCVLMLSLYLDVPLHTFSAYMDPCYCREVLGALDHSAARGLITCIILSPSRGTGSS